MKSVVDRKRKTIGLTISFNEAFSLLLGITVMRRVAHIRKGRIKDIDMFEKIIQSACVNFIDMW